VIEDVEPGFSGQVVKVLIEGPGDWQWWSLKEPRFERQHGRLFLVGGLTDPDPSKSFWGRKVRACVPWDGIRYYHTEAIVDRQQRKFGGDDCNTIAG
jgi:hypothetical protein